MQQALLFTIFQIYHIDPSLPVMVDGKVPYINEEIHPYFFNLNLVLPGMN